jgi:hypothetical protein
MRYLADLLGIFTSMPLQGILLVLFYERHDGVDQSIARYLAVGPVAVVVDLDVPVLERLEDFFDHLDNDGRFHFQ